VIQAKSAISHDISMLSFHVLLSSQTYGSSIFYSFGGIWEWPIIK